MEEKINTIITELNDIIADLEMEYGKPDLSDIQERLEWVIEELEALQVEEYEKAISDFIENQIDALIEEEAEKREQEEQEEEKEEQKQENYETSQENTNETEKI
ncbi:MAG: hypothetical protein QW051_01190 [Candidatus Aenigmatarchaeota archaeon]